MFDRRHPLGWLFYLLIAALASAQTPTTSTVSDFVYRADGTLAGGTLLISWPGFSTLTGQAVAAGNKERDHWARWNIVRSAGSKCWRLFLHCGVPT